MQTALYGHMIEADLAQIGRESPAALTQRFTTDFAFIREALTRLSTVFLREVTTIIALIARHAVDRPGPDPRGRRHRARSSPSPSTRSARSCGGSRSRPRSRPARWRASSPRASPAPASPRPMDSSAISRRKAAKTFDDVRNLKMKAANARGRIDPLLEAGGGFAVAAVLVLIGQRILVRRQHGRRFHRLRQRPRSWQRSRSGRSATSTPSCRRRPPPCSAPSRSWTRRPASRTGRRPSRSQLAGGEIRFSNVTSPTTATPTALDHVDLVAEAGRDHGAGRPLGLGQIDAPVPRAAPLRRQPAAPS